jgi:hypothetical protein
MCIGDVAGHWLAYIDVSVVQGNCSNYFVTITLPTTQNFWSVKLKFLKSLLN